MAKHSFFGEKKEKNARFYVIEHISCEQFLSLQRYKRKEKDVKPAFRNAEGTKTKNYEKEYN